MASRRADNGFSFSRPEASIGFCDQALKLGVG